MVPGEIISAAGDIEINAGRQVTTLSVANTGDRPIQVGSHYHFAETNGALKFDREQGARLSLGHCRRHGGALRARPDAGGHPGGLCRPAPCLGISRAT